jgi:hypothetical protein
MSVRVPGRFSATLEPGRMSPGVTGQYLDDHRVRGVVRVISATDRM